MNRLSTLILITLAGLLLASCGSSVSSTTQPTNNNYVYTMVVDPQPSFTLNAGDWSTIKATVDLTYNNEAPTAVAPQPPIAYFSSDERVTVSPAGEVCAGQWDARYLTCSPTSTLPAGFVTITAYNGSRNVSATTLLSVHPRAVSISLSAPVYTAPITSAVVNGQTVTSIPLGQYPLTTGCVSQNNFAAVNNIAQSNSQVQYTATALDAGGTPIPRCSVSLAAGCINDNDYTWTTDNSSVATASLYGFVAARNPGVTNVYATLDGTVSTPLGFATCPPSSIVLSTSSFTGGTPVGPYTTSDLTLNKGDQKYVTATMRDANGNMLIVSPLTYVTSDPLTGSFTSELALSSLLTANTSGSFSMTAACEPTGCNPAVANFTIPNGIGNTPFPVTGEAAGFGYPIYSNVIDATVQGITGSAVLVTGTTYPDGVTPSHRLLVYDSESLGLIQTIELANLPNSLVVAPNGTTAYLGSSTGLMVVNLTTYQSTLLTFPVVGGTTSPPEVVTGTVLGVSPDSRYVVVSDVPNGLVFYIDTTGTKTATRYTIPGITSVTFAADDSNTWIGGAAGVYVLQADTFVPLLDNASANVTSLAWMPDGQSYFASGAQMTNYKTCNDTFLPPQQSLISSVPQGLSTTAMIGASHLLGLDVNQWFDYSVTSTSQVPIQSAATTGALTPGGTGNVCLSTVNVAAQPTVPSTLQCTAQQISFSPKLEQEFITGVNPTCATPESVIHGYDVTGKAEITRATTAPVIPLSGGVLNDGRKLYFGTWESTATPPTGTLHRIDLSTGTGTPGTLAEDASVSVGVVPSFVAVVPK